VTLNGSGRPAQLNAYYWPIEEHVGITVNAWGSTLIFIGLSTVLLGGAVLAAWIFQVKPKYKSSLKYDTYECGEEPDGSAWIRFHPRYFIVGLVFVLFDVEAAFLLPWAVNIDNLAGIALIDMGIFLGILFLGWIYALKKGALRWQ
jgi:NADH-quinone oxidoreductase subunit A